MQIVPKGIPSANASTVMSTPSHASQAAKARAIALLTGSPSPLQASASSVSAENASAITHNTQRPQEEAARQDNTKDGVETPAATETKPDPLSSQYALLARKEKQIRAQAQSIQAERAALKAKELELEAHYKSQLETEKAAWKASLKSNPLAGITEAGLTYDELTQALLNPQNQQADISNSPIVRELQAKLKALEEKQTTSEKSFSRQRGGSL